MLYPRENTVLKRKTFNKLTHLFLFMNKEIVLRVGKKGINVSLHDEIKKNLLKNNQVKIKFLKNILDINEKQKLFDELQKVIPENVIITKKIGNTVLLEKK